MWTEEVAYRFKLVDIVRPSVVRKYRTGVTLS